MSDTLNSEKNRLTEIYQLLYPQQRVWLFLVATEFDYSRTDQYVPVQIDLSNTSALLSIQHQSYDLIDIGKDFSSAPTVGFKIFFPQQNGSTIIKRPVFSTLISSLKQRKIKEVCCFLIKKGISKIRFFLAKNTPLLYEHIKFLYLKLIDTYQRDESSFKQVYRSQNFPKVTAESNHRPKALITMHWLDVGGAEKFAIDCIKMLTDQGFETIIVSAHMSRNFYAKTLNNLYRVYEIERQVPVHLRVSFLAHLLGREQFDLIHNHHNIYLYRSLPFLKQLKPNVCIIDSLHIDEKPRFGYGFPRISTVWSEFIDHHHVISVRLQNLLLKHQVPESKIVFGHLGGDLIHTQTFKIKRSITNKKLTLCFVGRLSGQKRPLLAFSMFESAIKIGLKRGFDIKVNILGDGIYRNSLLTNIHKSQFKDRFSFFEGNTPTKTIYEESDILLITSENEGVTLVAFEAVEKGCLVISSNVGAQSELIPQSLLLPENPLKMRRTWKALISKLFKDSVFVDQVCSEQEKSALLFLKQPKAKNSLEKIWSKS